MICPASRWAEQQLGHPVDDAEAKQVVPALLDELGFDGVDAGGIDDS